MSTLLLLAILNAEPAIDVPEIVRRSAAATEASWKVAPEYAFQETDRLRDGTKTYEVTMIDGSPYQMLTAINGRPLSTEERAREQQKYQAASAQRRAESAQARSARIAKYQAERKRDHVMMQELSTAFDFKLAGEQRLGERDVYIVRATPREGYRPPNRESQALRGMEGQLWIDKETYQWVKVEAHVVRSVSISGFLARVDPGTYFELENTPVAAGIWLPKHYAMKARAKIL